MTREVDEAERVLAAAPGADRVRRELASLERVRAAVRMRDFTMARKRASAQVAMSRNGSDAEALSFTDRFSAKQGALTARRAARGTTGSGAEAGVRHGPDPSAGSLFGDPGQSGVGSKFDAELTVPRPDGSVGLLRLRVGDITEWVGDAIVNPTNPRLHGTGATVDGTVHRRGGMELTRECRAIGHVDVGETVVTKGWDLPADYVLHTASPAYDGTDRSFDLLKSCYRSSLVLARQLRLRRIAFPAIGTGSNGFRTRVSAEIALREFIPELADPAGPDEIDVVLFDVQTLLTYQTTLANIASGVGIAGGSA